MSTAPGQKAKLINFLDRKMADDLQSLYSIEIGLAVSPKQKVKCGAIVVFKLNNVDIGMGQFDKKMRHGDPEKGKQLMQEIQNEVNKMSEVMHQDPIYFKATEGRWVGWAVERAMELYDRLGSSADISVKCSQLRIKRKIPRKEISAGRGDLRKLFGVAWDIDRLLDKKYKFDPWSNEIRRGKIGAEVKR
jgi:hypothetical protein